MIERKTSRLKEMRQIVKEELEYIPRGDAPQQELRMFYQMLRMHSLGKKGKGESKEEVLKEAIASVRGYYPYFKPRYDEKRFDLPSG
jgi:hypothetical protein